MSTKSIAVILTRSPSRAPPVRGEEGSMANKAIFNPLPAQVASNLSIKQDLPTPGAPVMAIERQFSLPLDIILMSAICFIWPSVIWPFSKPVKVLAIDLRLPFMAALISWSLKKSPQAEDSQYQSLESPTPMLGIFAEVSINSKISAVGVPGPNIALILQLNKPLRSS